MSSYTSTWVCADCKTVNEILLNKTEAAFFVCPEYKKTTPCTNCGGKESDSSSQPLVEIDRGLMEMWLVNEGLYFLDQDEALLIADVSSEILLDMLARDHVSCVKRITLLEALIVRLTDELTTSALEVNAISEFLKLNQSQWDGNAAIWDYLQDRAKRMLKLS